LSQTYGVFVNIVILYKLFLVWNYWSCGLFWPDPCGPRSSRSGWTKL